MTNYLGAPDCPSFRTESPSSRETPQPGQLLSVDTMFFGPAHSRRGTVHARAGIYEYPRPLPMRCRLHALVVATENCLRGKPTRPENHGPGGTWG